MGYNSNHSTSKEIRERQKQERLGEQLSNNQGCLMKIVEYNDSHNIVVEFQDKHKYRTNTRYKDFIIGGVRNPYHPNVYGGILGVKYSAKVNGKTTKEYSTWHNMLQKCTNDRENIICDEWILYENFYEWLHKQENFDKWFNGVRWNLSNSIVSGNKVYSPEMCYLIPYNLKQLLEKLNIVADDLPEYLIQKHKKFTVFKIKQVAKEEFSKGNITNECYKTIVKRLTEN